jgi:hypothetical protein
MMIVVVKQTEIEAVPDEIILQQLGAAVLLCWRDLPLSAQRTILNQTDDMIGLKPVAAIRSEIMALLSRHAKA